MLPTVSAVFKASWTYVERILFRSQWSSCNKDRQTNWSLVLKLVMRYVKALTSTFCMFKRWSVFVLSCVGDRHSKTKVALNDIVAACGNVRWSLKKPFNTNTSKPKFNQLMPALNSSIKKRVLYKAPVLTISFCVAISFSDTLNRAYTKLSDDMVY